MCEFIRLSRISNAIPWGFRLIGGSDLNAPLTVIKINGGSIAERAGLQADDIIIEINGMKVATLTHSEVQNRILQARNDLAFAVLRGSPVHPPPLTPIHDLTSATPTEICYRAVSTVSMESVDSAYDMSSFEIIEHNLEGISSVKDEPSEDDIAQLLLENAEVLEENGKSVIGVNFKRFIPKCEFIKDSAVFQVLQEEQVHKELTEREQLAKCPNKRFSTFLNTPNRPIPKPKPKIKQEPSKNEVTDINPVKGHETCREIYHHENREDSNDINCTESEGNEFTVEVDEYKEDAFNDNNNNENDDNSAKKDTLIEEEEHIENCAAVDEADNGSLTQYTSRENLQSSETMPVCYEEKTEMNFFNEQLEIIKSTLDSLRQLPSLIESQLSEVQKRIDNITHLKTEILNQDVSASTDEEVRNNEEYPTSEDAEMIEIKSSFSETDEQTIDSDSNKIHDANYEQQVIENEQEEIRPLTNLANDEYSNNHFEEKKCRDRPVCPLTPLPRPLVLPGGRRWRKPKDAFNEEFIAETLISQAEVLVGSTLGVNFRKYEPPKFDLSNSAVYKMVHDIEANEKGIASRPEIVPAEQDYYQSPINARHFYCASLAYQQSNKSSSN